MKRASKRLSSRVSSLLTGEKSDTLSDGEVQFRGVSLESLTALAADVAAGDVAPGVHLGEVLVRRIAGAKLGQSVRMLRKVRGDDDDGDGLGLTALADGDEVACWSASAPDEELRLEFGAQIRARLRAEWTLEDVYQHVVLPSQNGGADAADSIAEQDEDEDEDTGGETGEESAKDDAKDDDKDDKDDKDDDDEKDEKDEKDEEEADANDSEDGEAKPSKQENKREDKQKKPKAKKAKKVKKKLYVQRLPSKQRGKAFQGAFVSAPRTTELAELVRSLQAHYAGADAGKTFVWLDVFCAEQVPATLALLAKVRQAASRFDERLVFLGSWLSPRALGRAWCVWEAMAVAVAPPASPRAGRKAPGSPAAAAAAAAALTSTPLLLPGEQERLLEALQSSPERAARRLLATAATRAKCHQKKDALAVRTALLGEFGDEATANEALREVVRGWLAAAVEAAVAAKRATLAPGEAIAWFGALLDHAGVVLDAHGLHAGAQAYYAEAIAICTKELGPRHKRLGKVLYHSALSHQRTQDLGRALAHSEQALQIMSNKMGAGHTEVANIHNSVAIILCNLNELEALDDDIGQDGDGDGEGDGDGDKDEGIEGEGEGEGEKEAGSPEERDRAQSDISTTSSASAVSSMATASVAESASSASRASGRTSQASRRTSQASQASQASRASSVPGSKLEAAKVHYEAALAVFREDKDDLKVAATLKNTAYVLTKLGEFDTAITYCTQALDIQERQLKRDDPKVASTLSNVGEMYRAQAIYPKALESYDRALAIHWRIICQKYSKDKELQRQLRKVLVALREDSDSGNGDGDGDGDGDGEDGGRAGAAAGSGARGGAESSGEPALHCYEKAEGMNQSAIEVSPEFLDVLQNKADLLMEQGLVGRAVELNCLRVAVLQRHDPARADTLEELADVFAHLGSPGSLDKACTTAEQALAIRQELDDDAGARRCTETLQGFKEKMRQQPA